MRAHRSTVLLAVLAAGAVLTQQACTPSAPAPETERVAATSDDALSGTRQVVIRPVQEFESIVAVDGTGRLNLTDGEAEHGLFVLTPHNDRFLIRTAKVESTGEPSCMGIRHNGSNPLTVEAAPCDTRRAGQLFEITEQDETDSSGRPTYAISNQGAFLQVFPRTGLIAQELGDAPLETTYAFVDNGPSTLPSQD